MIVKKGDRLGYTASDLADPEVEYGDDADMDAELRKFQRTDRKVKIGPSAKQLEKEREDQLYQEAREKGIPYKRGASEKVDDSELSSEKKKAMKIAQAEKQEMIDKMEREKAEREERRKYKKSSQFKRDQWSRKNEIGKKFNEDWEKIEQQHQAKCEEHQKEKERIERQRKIDSSWEVKTKTPTPQPKAGGKKGGAANKNLARYMTAGVQLPTATPAEEEVPLEKLPWNAEEGDLDPNRPQSEKKEEKKVWEGRDKQWKKYLEEWSRMKAEHQAQKDKLATDKAHFDTEEPEFHTDASSEEDESDSDSDDSDSD